MAQPYVGEIRQFAGNFAPAGWMFCEGQLLPISEYETLFNLIGTTYGGDGQSTFALPDLRGRIPLHFGNGFTLAETGGVETVTLTVSQIPAHSHPTDENVTVLRGVFLVGMGDKFDETKLQAMNVGNFVAMPKEARHFAISKGDTIVQVHGMGPFKVNWVNAADVEPPAGAKQ